MDGFTLFIFVTSVSVAGIFITALIIILLLGSETDEELLDHEFDVYPDPEPHKPRRLTTAMSTVDLDTLARELASALDQEPVDQTRYSYRFEFDEESGHAIRIDFKNRGRLLSLEWKSTLIDAPLGSWSAGNSPASPELRNHHLDHEQRHHLPLSHQTISDTVTLEDAYLNPNDIKVTLSIDRGARMARVIRRLRDFRAAAERDEVAISSALVVELARLEQHDSVNKELREDRAIEIYGWLEDHLQHLLDAGEVELAGELHLELVDLDSDLIDTLLSFSGLDDLDAHKRERLQVMHAIDTPTSKLAARCMTHLSRQDQKPVEWLDLLALHALTGEMSRESGQWFDHLLREAPLSQQAQKVASKLIQKFHSSDYFAPSAWRGYLPHEEALRAAFTRLLEHLLEQPMPERRRLGHLLTAVHFDLQPEHYKQVFTDFALANAGSDSRRWTFEGTSSDLEHSQERLSLMPLLREINAKIPDYQNIEPLIEPLGHLALSPVNPEERKEALRLLCGREFLDHSGPVEIFTEAMRLSERERDHELYVYCASTITSSFKGRPEAVEALGEIILAKKTHTLYEKALDVYPREKPEHYNFLLAIEDLPSWITDRLLEDVEQMERDDYEAYIPGLRALLETSTRHKVVLRVLGMVAKRDLTPFGPALIRLHGDSSFSPELRAWVGELLERWREQNAHLMGSLSLGEDKAAGALTEVSGERGGLTMRDDME